MKVFVLVTMAIVVSMLSGCAFTTIEPGHTGIKVNKLGSNRGVSKENIVSGLVFYNPIATKIVEYPTFNQRVALTADKNEGKSVDESISFQTKDNVPCNIDVAINYTLQESKVPEFYTKFRADKIEYFTHGFMRDQVRNAASQIGSEYEFDTINGTKKEEFVAKMNAFLAKSVNEYGVQIGTNGLSLIGAIRVPDNLKNAINARVQSTQDAIKSENDLRKMKAEAAKAVAQAEGQASANKIKASSLSPQLLEWEKMQIERERVSKWNGSLPSTLITNGAQPLLQVK